MWRYLPILKVCLVVFHWLEGCHARPRGLPRFGAIPQATSSCAAGQPIATVISELHGYAVIMVVFIVRHEWNVRLVHYVGPKTRLPADVPCSAAPMRDMKWLLQDPGQALFIR